MDKTYDWLTHYMQPSTMSPKQYLEPLVTKSLRCAEEDDQYVRKGIFFKCLYEAVLHTMRWFEVCAQVQTCTTWLILRCHFELYKK